LGIASLVLGIIALPTTCVCIGPILAIIAIALGIAALVRANSDPQRFGGRGQAIGGIITGGLAIIALPIMLLTIGSSLFGPALKVGGLQVEAEAIGTALQTYARTNGTYPPDLTTLENAGLIGPNPVPTMTGVPSDHFNYVPGLAPDAPAHWIIAYSEHTFMNVKLYPVVYADASADMLEQMEFNTEWSRFLDEYERQHGAPPELLMPPGNSPLETQRAPAAPTTP
jgi:hypothetical protein